VSTHLFFGFGDKSEAPFVAEQPAGCANRERAGVPDRTQCARALVEFVEALFAPRQVIKLLFGGAVHLFFDSWVPRNHGVALIESLCRNFTGMVDSHEAGGMCPLFIAEIGLVNVGRGILAGRAPCGGGDRAKRVVGSGQKSINWR